MDNKGKGTCDQGNGGRRQVELEEKEGNDGADKAIDMGAKDSQPGKSTSDRRNVLPKTQVLQNVDVQDTAFCGWPKDGGETDEGGNKEKEGSV